MFYDDPFVLEYTEKTSFLLRHEGLCFIRMYRKLHS